MPDLNNCCPVTISGAKCSRKPLSIVQRKGWSAIAALALIFSFTVANAQNAALSGLEKRVEDVIEKIRSTSVFITDYDPVRKVAISERFSGVVVDVDGTILTVAHTMLPGVLYQVTFSDGKKYTAKGLGRIASLGCGVLKINEKGTWPFAEMGRSSLLKQNQPCISIAYPASFDNQIPIARFGYIAEVVSAKQANRIRTTCLMEPGDSGGPVYDLEGKVIGMNNNIDYSLEANFEIPIDLYRKYWYALQDGTDYLDLPVGVALGPENESLIGTGFDDLTAYGDQLSQAEKSYAKKVVAVSSSIGAKKIGIFATVISVSGKSFLISKSSMVGDSPSISQEGENDTLCRVIYRDEKKDLVLLSTNLDPKSGIPLSGIEKTVGTKAILGEFLCSPLPNGEASWSIIGSAKFDLEAKFRAGYSGAGSVMRTGKLILEMVVPGSGAYNAKLKSGDEILAVNGKTVQDPDTYISEIRKHSPGEIITMTRKNSVDTQVLEVTLASFPEISTGHPAEFFKGGKSMIRDGFSGLFVHDGKIAANECGGPVFSLKGELMGINIGRYSRTSNLLLSTPQVLSFLREGLSNLRASL